MRTVALFEMLFGLITLVGGIIGFASAGSAVSLIAGGVCGLLLIYSGLQMQKGSRRGLFIALIVTLALLGQFGYAFFFGAGTMFPAGTMAILSILSLLAIIVVLVQPKKRERIF